MQILAEIGHLGDPRGKAVRRRARPGARILHPNALGPQQDGDLALGALAARRTAAQPEPGGGLDDRALPILPDDARWQQVGAADKLGDEARRRLLVDLTRRADLL